MTKLLPYLLGLLSIFPSFLYANTCSVSGEGKICYHAYQSATSNAVVNCKLPSCQENHCYTVRSVQNIVSEEKDEQSCKVEVDYSLTCNCPF